MKPNIFSIYPNPTNGEINLSFDKEGIYSVLVFDILGKEVHSSQATGATYKISLPQNAKGTYLIKVTNENGISGQRVVIVR